jgi:hypothetical protein
MLYLSLELNTLTVLKLVALCHLGPRSLKIEIYRFKKKTKSIPLNLLSHAPHVHTPSCSC